MSFFNKIKELFTNPQLEQSHDDWFYHTKIYSKKIVLFYKKITQQLSTNSIVKTADILLPLNLNFGATIAEVEEVLGSPRCSFNNKKQDYNIQTFFYRKNYVYEHVLFQLQFYNGLLFFVSVETGKNQISETEKVKSISNFLPSLISESYKSIQSIPIFTDTNSHFLIVEDEVNMCIHYLSNVFINNQLENLEEATKNGYNPPKKKRR